MKKVVEPEVKPSSDDIRNKGITPSREQEEGIRRQQKSARRAELKGRERDGERKIAGGPRGQ